MQVINFPAPESIIQQQVVEVLEGALAAAREGDITSVVVIALDDRSGEDRVTMTIASDGWTQTAGMLMAAQKGL